MSQVAVMEEPHEFERSVRDAEFIVVVEKKLETKVNKEVKFPKETHYNKEMETVYQEFVDIYKVKEVLYPTDLSLPEGKITVRVEDAYHLEDIKASHETGGFA